MRQTCHTNQLTNFVGDSYLFHQYIFPNSLINQKLVKMEPLLLVVN